MKRILFCLFILTGFFVNAQIYNNEWIDHNKTYYKFKVGKTGLYRISQSALSSAGLGSASAEQFQLWRNGMQVPIFTSIPSGTLGSSDFIEFWGEMNDGRPDSAVYRKKEYQLNNKWSLQTDSATYFLTTNTSGANFRLTPATNNVSGNSLPAEPYFMYTIGNYFKNKINNGYAVEIENTYMYSSSYDKGEGWTSNDIGTNGTNSFTFNNLFTYGAGPAANFSINLSGNSNHARRYRADINGDSIIGSAIDYFDMERGTASVPASLLASNSANVVVSSLGGPGNDRMVIHQYKLTYPRQFNFGGASNFEFELPAAAGGNYLEITGFNFGSTAPVLYDLTNGKRYIADNTSTPGTLKVVLGASLIQRQLVLVSQENSNITAIGGLTSRNFINYSLSANAGDYLIISNPALFNGTGGVNPVEEYRLYRSSANGGGYNARIYLTDDLVDQFGFGIKKHPLALRNFIRYARERFANIPRQVFLIGKGIHYTSQRNNEANPDLEKLNLVPTFGWPASDILLTTNPGDGIPKVSIGRLSVIIPQEVEVYLKKVKEYEGNQRLMSPLIADKAWMKNVVHMVGASGELGDLLTEYIQRYEKVIRDTFFGANVTLFTKTSTSAIEQVNNGALDKLFEEGITLMTYYGHSSATTLEFNLNNPDQYKNYGKYPMLVALGCNAGNFFNFNPARFQTTETLSEKFVLAPDKGMIGFMASSHLGIVSYLDIYNTRQYKSISVLDYGKSIGEIVQSSIIQTYAYTSQEDFYARASNEEIIYHGDPAITLNPHSKPDYVIEEPLVKLSPNFVSVADQAFQFKAKFLNIGKAVNKNIVVEIKRELPNGSINVVFRDTLPGIRYADSININIPIDPLKDKGKNKLIVTIDADNVVDELFENNNTISKEIFIYEDEARPIYPYNLSIVGQPNIKLIASTANPFSTAKQYKMEIDTTELFSSPLSSQTLTSSGGVMEFNPGINFTNNTVYYWRVAVVPSSGDYNWNAASFIYLNNYDNGFNQSHFYQHLKSGHNRLILDSASRQWSFDSIQNNLTIRNGVFFAATVQEGDLTVSVNGERYIRSACVGYSLIFNVFDPRTFKPLENPNGFMNSGGYCAASRLWNFEYSYLSKETRKNAMDFMDWIPDGSYVVVRNIMNADQTTGFVDEWKSDTAFYGSGNSLYHKLKNVGFSNIDLFTDPMAFGFVFQKGPTGFTPVSNFSEGMYDVMTLSADITTPDSVGYLTSPVIGPSKGWKQLMWSGSSLDAPVTDNPTINIIGIKNNGSIDTLLRGISYSTPIVDLSAIDNKVYPYLQLHMRNIDSVNYTPFQLQNWRVTYLPAPEGVVAPNIYFSMKDTVEAGEPIEFKMAFKNITNIGFDSLKVKMVVTDRNNIANVLPVLKHRPLSGNDTLHIRHHVDTRLVSGASSLYVEVNPDNDQPEQYHFNNFIYKDFFVRGDTLHPILDVTFDNQHILNGDIVSAKPDIVIKLKDESKWMLLDDTSLVAIQIKDPDGIIRNYNFNNDTLRFIPAQPNSGNAATINFKPYFQTDGYYELIVKGKDKSSNQAGTIEYRVGFEVINKAMISNMLNYPNPFTTSTAFVFTITGAEVPQNFRIQILTVTGKIVREIMKEELGPLRIGRNITEYKWDGTDQYGQKLGNGVYLYRVITNLNGQSLEKYKAKNENTDKYFNKGYGKMYLMR